MSTKTHEKPKEGEERDQTHYFINSIISRLESDGPESIRSHKLTVGDGNEFVMPSNLDAYNESQWEIEIGEVMFVDTLGTVCTRKPVPDHICIMIRNGILSFQSFCNSKSTPDIDSQHAITSAVEYTGYFNPASIKDAAKRGINPRVHLRWTDDVPVLVVTYYLSPSEDRTNSHLSYYIAQKIMD
jgi:hypothetical protein